MADWINDPQGREEIEKVTKELKLPVWKANHKGKFRDFWNELWDKIEDYILKLKGDTEKNSKGLNDRLVSAVGKHDGDFPIANAVVGNVYYSELTKKYYKCKVGGPAPMPNGNFIDMSILENLNRLENLSSSGSKKIELNILNSSHSYAYRIGDICILNIDSGGAFIGKKADDILFKLPSNLLPKTRTIATLGSFVPSLSREIVVYIEPNGNCILKSQNLTCQTAYYGNISYIVQN
ncbi:hypothetical protein [Fusobacterium pseudoperiodonticum]|uniref:hypothetical protein n=1 Tax=Fusobacterium pseudoperiodonticum TaxID=2663009 RepID=UPI001D175D00|nr:hypothetical protein [Fusobacterium pseudoperiodonticum]